jgi:hypothetical protein
LLSVASLTPETDPEVLEAMVNLIPLSAAAAVIAGDKGG